MNLYHTACYDFLVGTSCPPGSAACAVTTPAAAALSVQGRGPATAAAVVVSIDIAHHNGGNMTRSLWLGAEPGVGKVAGLEAAVGRAAGLSATSHATVAVVAVEDMEPGRRHVEGDLFGKAHGTEGTVRVQVAIALHTDADVSDAIAMGGSVDQLRGSLGSTAFAAALSSELGEEVDVAQASVVDVTTPDISDLTLAGWNVPGGMGQQPTAAADSGVDFLFLGAVVVGAALVGVAVVVAARSLRRSSGDTASDVQPRPRVRVRHTRNPHASGSGSSSTWQRRTASDRVGGGSGKRML